jgi:fucokinase
MAASTTRSSYLSDTSARPASPTVQAARQAIWDLLRGTSFTVQRLRPAVFVHVSTSHEYWRVVAADRELAQVCDWTSQAVAWLGEPARRGEDRLVLINATTEGPVAPGSRQALVADCKLLGPLSWQGAAIVSDVQTAQPLALGEDVVVHQLPVAGRFVTRIYGLTDDPKQVWNDPSATFFNRPWAEWLISAHITPELLWPGLPPQEWTLWNARLYPLSVDRENSLRLSLPLQDPGQPPENWRAEWEAAERLSLAESYKQADSHQILADSTAVEDHISVRRTCAAILAERPAVEIADMLGSTAHARERRSAQTGEWLAQSDPILRLRGYKALTEATDDVSWEDRAFATLAEMIEDSVQELQGARTPSASASPADAPSSDAPSADITSVRVEACARVDFGGGWTDTPPYSIERGGQVLNAALTLKGAYPIVVEATRLPEPRLLLQSRDIDLTLEPTTLGEVTACSNPADPFCLSKASLVLRGFLPADGDPGAPLSDLLRAQGYGLRLTTGTSIPRGSGLGTSSILAGAVLACLGRVQGVELSNAALFDEVLCLEQMMTTGGGWQDQVGGLVGGIKLVRSEPGLPQVIQVDPLSLSPETQADLAQRLVLVYTGQQRLAKNLLRIVVGRWLGRDPEMVWLLSEIARLADEQRSALQRGDVSAFGELLGEHWSLNKRMDPGCTNPFIDGLFQDLEPYIHGGKLAGAGGGGFAIVVTRGQDGERELARALEARYSHTPVAVWPTAIPAQAMVVHTNTSI